MLNKFDLKKVQNKFEDMDSKNENLYILQSFIKTMKEKINGLLDNLFEEFLINFENMSSEKKSTNINYCKNLSFQNPNSSKAKYFEISNEEKMIKYKIDEIILNSFNRKNNQSIFKKSHLDKSNDLKSDFFIHQKLENLNYKKNRFPYIKYNKKLINNFKKTEDFINIFSNWQKLLDMQDKILELSFSSQFVFTEKLLNVEKLWLIFKDNQKNKFTNKDVNSNGSISAQKINENKIFNENFVTQHSDEFDSVQESNQNMVQNISENEFFEESNVNEKIAISTPSFFEQLDNLILTNLDYCHQNSSKSLSLILNTEETLVNNDDTTTSYLGTFENSKNKDLFLEYKLAKIHKNIIFEADLVYKKIENEKDQKIMNIAYLIREKLNDMIDCIIINKTKRTEEIGFELRHILDFYKIYIQNYEVQDDYDKNYSNKKLNNSNVFLKEMQPYSFCLESKNAFALKPPPFPKDNSYNNKYLKQKLSLESKFEKDFSEETLETIKDLKNTYLSPNFDKSSCKIHISDEHTETDHSINFSKDIELSGDDEKYEKFSIEKSNNIKTESSESNYSDEQMNNEIFQSKEDISSKLFTEITFSSDKTNFSKNETTNLKEANFDQI